MEAQAFPLKQFVRSFFLEVIQSSMKVLNITQNKESERWGAYNRTYFLVTGRWAYNRGSYKRGIL